MGCAPTWRVERPCRHLNSLEPLGRGAGAVGWSPCCPCDAVVFILHFLFGVHRRQPTLGRSGACERLRLSMSTLCGRSSVPSRSATEDSVMLLHIAKKVNQYSDLSAVPGRNGPRRLELPGARPSAPLRGRQDPPRPRATSASARSERVTFAAGVARPAPLAGAQRSGKWSRLPTIS